MKMDSLDSLTYGGVRGRENLFNFPSYSIEHTLVFSIGKILNTVYSSIGSKGGIHNAEGNMFYY